MDERMVRARLDVLTIQLRRILDLEWEVMQGNRLSEEEKTVLQSKRAINTEVDELLLELPLSPGCFVDQDHVLWMGDQRCSNLKFWFSGFKGAKLERILNSKAFKPTKNTANKTQEAKTPESPTHEDGLNPSGNIIPGKCWSGSSLRGHEWLEFERTKSPQLQRLENWPMLGLQLNSRCITKTGDASQWALFWHDAS